MTKYGSPDVAFFLVDGLSLVGTLTEFSDQHEAVIEETTPLGTGWEEQTFAGVRKGEISQDGYYDDAAMSAHDALSSGPGTARILAYGLEGTATGKRFTAYQGAMQVNYERLSKRDELTKAKAQYKSSGQVEQGRVLFSYGAVGSTGRKNAYDGAASSTGAAGYLSYNATAGEANVRIMHSSDNITYAALFVFAKIASGHGAERVVTTGVIERYVAADFTTATATGSIGALNAMVGIVYDVI